MKRIVIVGCGGHGREVLEILRDVCANETALEALGFLDDDPAKHNHEVDGLPVLGGLDWLAGPHAQSDVAVVCAVGQPRVARRLAQRVSACGVPFTTIISPRAMLSPHALLGEGTTIFPQVVIGPGTSIGNHSILNVGVSISHDTVVGAFCNLNPGARVAGSAQIGDGCYLGMSSSVLPGVRIGRGSIIGAGAVVIRDVPPDVTVVGVPARVVRTHHPTGEATRDE